jgi:hypothetical protein
MDKDGWNRRGKEEKRKGKDGREKIIRWKEEKNGRKKKI